MAELHEQANRLREENDRLRTQLEAGRAGQSREPPRPFPSSRTDKGKEVAAPDDVDMPANDELSSGSSSLPHRSPSPNAAEAYSRKRPPLRSSRSISVARRRVRREPSRDRRPPTPAHQYVPDWARGLPPPVDIIFKTKHPLELINSNNWFWSDCLQVHRSTSNKMDLSPDIDPTEISRIYLSTTPTTQISYYLDNQRIWLPSLKS